PLAMATFRTGAACPARDTALDGIGLQSEPRPAGWEPAASGFLKAVDATDAAGNRCAGEPNAVGPWLPAPFTMPTRMETMSPSSRAWAASSSLAEADSSALAALDWVNLSISVTAVPICSMPLVCSWLAVE